MGGPTRLLSAAAVAVCLALPVPVVAEQPPEKERASGRKPGTYLSWASPTGRATSSTRAA